MTLRKMLRPILTRRTLYVVIALVALILAVMSFGRRSEYCPTCAKCSSVYYFSPLALTGSGWGFARIVEDTALSRELVPLLGQSPHQHEWVTNTAGSFAGSLVDLWRLPDHGEYRRQMGVISGTGDVPERVRWLGQCDPKAAAMWARALIDPDLTEQASLELHEKLGLLTALKRLALTEEDFARLLEACGSLGDSQPAWAFCKGACLAAAKERNDAEARRWARATYDVVLKGPRARKTAGLEALRAVAEAFGRAKLTTNGKGHAEFADAVVSLAERGLLQGLEYDHSLVDAVLAGRMLLSTESRQVLHAGIAGKRGCERTGLTEILAWAHRGSRTLVEWRKLLDAKIASPQDGRDAKAYWLAARAYAEVMSYGEAGLFIGNRWLNPALTTAESQEARLYVVGRMAASYADPGAKRNGMKFLDGMGKRFSFDPKALAALHARFQTAYEQTRAREHRKRGTREVAYLARTIHRWKNSLAKAKEAGNKAAAEKAEEVLERLGWRLKAYVDMLRRADEILKGAEQWSS